MTPESETALAFARECIGWEDAFIDNERSAETVLRADRRDGFNYTILGAILGATQNWCACNAASLSLQWTPFTEGENNYNACISFPTSSVVASGIHLNPCQALMLACIEAARKLKEKAA